MRLIPKIPAIGRWLSAIWDHRNTIALWLARTLLMIAGMLGAWVDLHLPGIGDDHEHP